MEVLTLEEYLEIRKEHDKHIKVLQNLSTRYTAAANIPDLHERVEERTKCAQGMELARQACNAYMSISLAHPQYPI